MKFHCDRCKTKYSISDDRVRGKILKIRCKNCSAVITVREPGASTAATGETARTSNGQTARDSAGQARHSATTAPGAQATRGQEALAGAFKKAVTQTDASASGSGAAAPPVSLDAEWYLSKDGEQEGPFALEDARDWVRSKAASDELYVWSEGYDDWLAIEKVSHFRGVRRAALPTQAERDEGDEMTMVDASGGLGFMEETPKPLFAATMAAVSGGHPDSIEEDLPLPGSLKPAAASAFARSSPQASSFPSQAVASPASTRAPAIPQAVRAPVIPQAARAPAVPSNGVAAGKDTSPNLDFEIGEASRVVDLQTLMAQRGNARPLTPGGNPMPGVDQGLGRGSGAANALSGLGASAATPGAELPPVALPSQSKKRRSATVPLVAAGVLLAAVAAVFLYVFLSDSGTEKSVARGAVGGSGNLGYSFNERGQRVKIVNPEEEPETSETETSKGSGKGKKSVGGNRPNNSGSTTANVRTDPVRDPNEVDLSGPSTKGPTGPLDGDDLMQVYRKNNIAIKMCYERSLKKNPLLKVPKTWVDIQVGLDGRVSSVKIPSLATTELGNCILGRISRWRFRQTTEVFSSRFPLVFGT